MTLAVRKRLARKVRAAVSYDSDFRMVAVTEPVRGYYHIQVLLHEAPRKVLAVNMTKTMTQTLLEAVPEIFLVAAEVNDAGVPQLVFHATGK